MKRRPHVSKPVFNTLAQVQAGDFYAAHVDHPMRYPMTHISDAEMDRLQHACDPAQARGVPVHVNHKDGVIRVWPWPAEGFQVWSAITNRPHVP